MATNIIFLLILYNSQSMLIDKPKTSLAWFSVIGASVCSLILLYCLFCLEKPLKMPSCAMRYCKNYTGKISKTQGITYHSFPANELMRLRWIDIVRRQRGEETWMANRSSKICCQHFKPEDKYTSNKGNIMVKKSAIPYGQDEVWKYKWVAVIRKHRHEPEWTPTQYSRVCSNHFKPTDLYETGKGLKRITKGAVPCFQVPPAIANTEEDNRSGSPLSEDLISDTDSIFDTPLVATLKKQLDLEKKKSKNSQRQAHTFKKRAKYFENKTTKLRGIVKQLKNTNELYKKIISKLTETVKKAKQG